MRMRGQLLVTLQGDKEARSHLYDKDVDSLLWVSFEERPTERLAAVCIRMLDGHPVAIPVRDTAAYVDEHRPALQGPVHLDWDRPALLLLRNKGWTSERVLYVRPVPEGVGLYTRLILGNRESIVVGRSQACDIRYANPYVSSEHLRIFKSNGTLAVEDLRSANGTTVNGSLLAPLQPRWLSPGDVVQVLDFTLMAGDGFLCVNQPEGIRMAEELSRGECPVAGVIPRADIAEEGLWADPRHRFYPAPRLCKSLHRFALSVEAPPLGRSQPAQSSIMGVGASLLMGMSSLCMLLPAVMRILEGEDPFAVMPALAMGISMVGMSVVLPLAGRASDAKRIAAEEAARVNAYTAYLDGVENQIRAQVEEQSHVLRTNRMGMDEIMDRARSLSPLLMNRTSLHEDFMQLRVGKGDQEVFADISWPVLGAQAANDPLFAKLRDLKENLPLLHDVPLTIDLIRRPVVGVLGGSGVAWEFVRGLLVQICALHSYEEVRVLLVVREDEYEEWGFMAPLCHANMHAASGERRLVWVTQAGMADFDRIVEDVLGRPKNEHGTDGERVHVHYVAVCANKELCGSSQGIRRLVGLKEPSGFSLVFVGSGLQDLPKECEYLVCLGRGSEKLLSSMLLDGLDGMPYGTESLHVACMFERNDVLGTIVTFEPDILVSREEAGEFSHALASLRLDVGPASDAMPSSLGFMQLFGVGNVEQLNIGLRWKENHASRSLGVPIGVDAKGGVLCLDLHERRHGPHGLVAGTTGSGKSELLITYILSLCVSYSPDEVAFVLIDYKGGGLAGAFRNQGLCLPHLAGVITNLDGPGIRRSLASIRSELRRRQATFAMARERTGELTMDIYSYLALYRLGRIEEPMPHLFIVADEFAELRQQEPDFMAELVSAARIGRSLGIHLVLATQRPTGVVDEQIWSNARFKVALKVADASDSREIIRRDDAAAITRPGNFFLLVGYGETFVEGQAAFAGFPYIERERCESRRDDSVDLVDVEGNVLLSLRPEQPADSQGVTELNALLEHIQNHAAKAGKRAKPLWLDPLPMSISLFELNDRNDTCDSHGLPCVVGLVDDPDAQRQFCHGFDLASVGSAVIYGMQGSDPEGLLVAMALGLAKSRAPKLLWLYGVDLGTNRLAALAELPHSGGVMHVDDEERIGALFRLIDEELARRRAVLAPYGGDLDGYNQRAEDPIPRMVIVLSNLGALGELYPSVDDRLVGLTRDSPRCGIHFLMTASSVEVVRMRLRSNLGMEVPTQLNDRGDYATVLGQSPDFLPMPCALRGLVRIGDGIYEFQGASAGEDIAQEVLCAKKIGARMSCLHGGPPPIPKLPRHVMAKDMLAGRHSCGLPVGFSKRDIVPVFLKLGEIPIVPVLGNDSGALVRYVGAMWETIVQADRSMRAIVVDLRHALGDLRDAGLVGTADELAQLVHDLRCGVVTLDLLIVLNVMQVLEAIDGQVARELEALLEEMPTQTCANVVVVSELWRTRNLYAPWYQAALSTECGIWVGSGFCDQTALRFARMLPAYKAPAQRDDGFVVLHGNVEPVRLLSVGVESV